MRLLFTFRCWSCCLALLWGRWAASEAVVVVLPKTLGVLFPENRAAMPPDFSPMMPAAFWYYYAAIYFYLLVKAECSDIPIAVLLAPPAPAFEGVLTIAALEREEKLACHSFPKPPLGVVIGFLMRGLLSGEICWELIEFCFYCMALAATVLTCII